MGKRKRRQSAELPLFDLPLRPGEEREPGGAEPGGAEPGGAEPSEAARPAAGRGPSILFDDAQDAGASQLDLVEVEKTAVPASAEPRPDSGKAGEPDDRALLGDRLLGGMADLAVQLLAAGLTLAAVHALEVPVTWVDWMPFGVLALVFSFLYWVVPLAFWGQTPGMAWVGHVARAAGGDPLTFGQTFRRWLGALFTLAFAGLPLLLALTGRSFTDRLSDSYTVTE